jgi:hypothetical protein
MSGVAKAIGKVFKKVANVVKKVAPIALAAGAILFTGGAALGLTAGFGGAIAGALGSVGISTTGALGSILTGAVTQAGYGAAIGGVASMVGGGDFEDGAAIGAIGGAITGGLTGAVGAMGAPAAASAPSTTGAMTVSSKGLPAAGMPMARPAGLMAATSAAPATVAAPAVAAPAGLASAAPAAGKGFWDFVNTPAVASTIAGAAQGALSGMGEGDDSTEQQIAWNREQQDRVTSSYDIDPGALDSGASAVSSVDKARTTSIPRRARARWSPEAGRIVYS